MVVMAMVAAGVFGLVMGSFLNVCIHRLPRGESVVAPRSRCPHCAVTIRPLDNIPVLSYLVLGGRCRACGARISPRYPLVEGLTAVCFAAAIGAFGPTLRGVLAAAFLGGLVVVTFVDLDHQIIPRTITFPGILLGLLGALLGAGPPAPDALVSCLAGAGFLYLVATAAEEIINWHVEKEEDWKPAMGAGDFDLAAMMGAFLGSRSLIVAFLAATLTGSAVGLTLIAIRRHEWGKHIPFGPYLALGAAVALFFGEAAVRWYLGLLRPRG
ncbi:MAG TPA: prepilin peptidase [Candidatus Methylomirabilis sp.]